MYENSTILSSVYFVFRAAHSPFEGVLSIKQSEFIFFFIVIGKDNILNIGAMKYIKSRVTLRKGKIFLVLSLCNYAIYLFSQF